MIQPILCPACMKARFGSEHQCDRSEVPPEPNPAMKKAKKAAEARLSYYREMTASPAPDRKHIVLTDYGMNEAQQAAYRQAIEDAAKACEEEIRVMGAWESMDPDDYARNEAENDARKDCADAIRNLGGQMRVWGACEKELERAEREAAELRALLRQARAYMEWEDGGRPHELLARIDAALKT